jgi:general secretion pathway protein L
MTLGPAFASVALQIGWARETLHGFGHWWLREFLDLFPQGIADWLVDSGGRTLVLAPEVDAVALYLKTDRGRLLASRRVARADYSPDLIDAFLRSHRQHRAQASIGLGLPEELIFQRSFAVPLETRRALNAVVVQDLLAKTPFQLEDVHHAHRVIRAGDKLVVSQCVVSRAHVAAAAEALGLDPEEIGVVESLGTSPGGGPQAIVTKGSSAVNRHRWVRWTGLGLAATALLLAVAVLGTRYYRQQAVLDALQAQVAAVTVKARSVQGAIDKLQQEQALVLRLRAKRDEPGLLEVWEEATRILPAHTWLSELRLSETAEGRQMVLTGFSAAAASLVGLLDASAVFTEASLVGPIAVDPAEGKERFIIQAKLKPPASSRTALQ